MKTNNAPQTSRLKPLFLVSAVVFVSVALYGCNQSPTETSQPIRQVPPAPSPTPKTPPALADESQSPETPTVSDSQLQTHDQQQVATAEQETNPFKKTSSERTGIDGCSDLIALQEMVNKMQESGPLTPEVLANVDKRREELSAEAKVHPVSDALDLLECRWQSVDPDNYQFKWLFKVKAPVKHHCLAYVFARVDKSQIHLVEKDHGYQHDGLLNWTLDLRDCPPSSEWKTGDYVLATSRPIPAKAIPYHISFNLFYNDENKKPQKYGETVDLGWLADLGETH